MPRFLTFLAAVILPGSLAAGVVYGALGLLAAFDHNTQGQVCDGLAPAESHDFVLHAGVTVGDSHVD
jgi:hypothetical protein